MRANCVCRRSELPGRAFNMSEPLVVSEIRDGIAVLILNHPQKRNALSTEMLKALKEIFDGIAADSSVRVVVLRANGPVFSAGHDLRELVGRPRKEYEAL